MFFFSFGERCFMGCVSFFETIGCQSYVLFLLLGVVTVALYITFCVVHFPGRGQLSLLWQLHLSSGWLFVVV